RTVHSSANVGNVLVWITSIPALSNPFPIDIDNGSSPPVINSITPSNVDAFKGGTVTINGNFFTGTSSIMVQGVAHADFTLVDDSTITFSNYTAVALGNADVTATNGFGTSNTGHFTYVATDPPVLAGEPKAFTGVPYTWEMGASANAPVLLIANATGAGVPYGGGTLLFPFTTLATGTTN